ncbi:McrC family protein [Gemmatimonas sp.]|uniref:McrC family protein n=1 Tax=Gemmatimonas sp. TaxID=1962908 RepID=UPI0035643738
MPSPRLEIQLGEYQRGWFDVPSPSPADLQLSERLAGSGGAGGRLTVRWLIGGRAEILASSWVGVARFSSFDVHVTPKYVGGALGVLQMLEYASSVDLLHRLGGRAVLAEGCHLLDLICLLLVEEAEALVRAGLLRSYRPESEALPVLRGRLRYRDQLIRRYGRVDVLECDYDEYDADIAENRLLAAGLLRARERATDRSIRAAASRLSGILEDVCRPIHSDVGAYEQEIAYGRRNASYQPAHELAKLLLLGTAFDDIFNTRGAGVGAFLISMNPLFERFVERLVTTSLANDDQHRVLAQHRVPTVIRDEGTGRTYSQIRPDILVEAASPPGRIPIDTKYKLYDAKKLSTDDIYQSFLYGFALSTNPSGARAGIVYPSAAGDKGTVLTIHQVGGPAVARVAAVGLDVPSTLTALRNGRGGEVYSSVRGMVAAIAGRGVLPGG